MQRHQAQQNVISDQQQTMPHSTSLGGDPNIPAGTASGQCRRLKRSSIVRCSTFLNDHSRSERRASSPGIELQAGGLHKCGHSSVRMVYDSRCVG